MNWLQIIYNRLSAKISLPFEDLYLDIADDAWNSMEITLGPCVNEGDILIVESLLEKYCPSATVNRSVLDQTIRK